RRRGRLVLGRRRAEKKDQGPARYAVHGRLERDGICGGSSGPGHSAPGMVRLLLPSNVSVGRGSPISKGRRPAEAEGREREEREAGEVKERGAAGREGRGDGRAVDHHLIKHLIKQVIKSRESASRGRRGPGECLPGRLDHVIKVGRPRTLRFPPAPGDPWRKC